MENKKKITKTVITVVAAVLVVALLAGLPLIASSNEDDSDVEVTIESAQAAKQDIDTVLVSGGQLASDGVYSIEIPENVKIKEFLVGNGDTVSKGDPIAEVDKVSVYKAISDVQDTLEELAGNMAEADTTDSTTTTGITAKSNGTLKKIYAQTGDEVEDVMLKYGALAVVSLDNTMAVDLETDSTLGAGDKVTVTINDTEVAGRVKSNVAHVITVTFDDDNYEIGAEVKVSSDGKTIGKGSAYVYNAWNVVGYSGTISYVYAEEGQTLCNGSYLFAVTDEGKTSEFQVLADKRQKYEDLIDELFIMYDSGVVSSPCDGIVSGIDTDGDFMLTSAGADASSSGAGIVLLSNYFDSAAESTAIFRQTSSSTSPETKIANEIPGLLEAQALAKVTITCTPTVAKNGNDYTFAAYFQAWNNNSAVAGTWFIGHDETINITEEKDDLDNNWHYVRGEVKVSSKSESPSTVSPTLSVTFTPDNSTLSVAQTTVKIQVGSSGGSSPSGTTSNTGGGGMGGNNQTVIITGDGLYTRDTVDIATVTSQEQMTLTVSIDEYDITKVYVGQKATITMNSIAEEPVEAVVDSISNSGENEGGNSKISVKLKLQKSSNMLPGMNATATMVLDTTEDVLCVPSSAVYDTDQGTVVYTSYNAKDKALGDPVVVTTGKANSDYVEITSGITEGQTVYYEVYNEDPLLASASV